MATFTCPACHGEGVLPDPTMDGFLDMECPACNGHGWLDTEDDDDTE